MQQFMKIARNSLLILNLVSSLETTSGIPMISMTASMTVMMSTVSPRVTHTMNGIHTSERT